MPLGTEKGLRNLASFTMSLRPGQRPERRKALEAPSYKTLAAPEPPWGKHAGTENDCSKLPTVLVPDCTLFEDRKIEHSVGDLLQFKQPQCHPAPCMSKKDKQQQRPHSSGDRKKAHTRFSPIYHTSSLESKLVARGKC